MKTLFFLLFAFLLTGILNAQSDSDFVILQDVDSLIVPDVRYATVNNFTHQVLYPNSVIYLRKVVADSLSRANAFLMKHFHLRIKIFDGFRPLKIQKKMWKLLPDERYVANPSKGSRHNRGAAVDITLIDIFGRELQMGTDFDDFTVKAHYDYPELNIETKLNRKLLRETMQRFGFNPLSTEWWHFDFKNWQKFSILNDFPVVKSIRKAR